MEALRQEKLELTKNRNEEKEWATYVLNKLRSTYEKKAAEYEGQAQAAAAIITRLRKEKQEVNVQAQFRGGPDPAHHVGMEGPSSDKHQQVL